MLRRIPALFMVLMVMAGVSGCNLTQLTRWQEQTGTDLTAQEEKDLIALPDFMSDNCIWVETGMRARGLNEEANAKSQRYGLRESRCCPNIVGGQRTGSLCEVIGKFRGMDPTDTGAFQFNGYRPSGGVNDSTPAKNFCHNGVRRFRDGVWTDELSYPCDQWVVLDDPELQMDMLYMLIVECGFGSWEPVRTSRGKEYPCKPGNWFATPEVYMSPAA